MTKRPQTRPKEAEDAGQLQVDKKASQADDPAKDLRAVAQQVRGENLREKIRHRSKVTLELIIDTIFDILDNAILWGGSALIGWVVVEILKRSFGFYDPIPSELVVNLFSTLSKLDVVIGTLGFLVWTGYGLKNQIETIRKMSRME